MRSLSSSTILWRQVWGLAALLGAITFTWMVYGFCQPKILENLGFTNIVNNLGIIQGILGAVIEPYFGGVSDQVMRRFGSRLPIISVGVTLAGIIFVMLSFLLQRDIVIGWRWLIPVLMTIWVMAMIIFRGPAIALLMQFSPSSELPKTSSILVLVFGLVGAISPLLGNLIQFLGTSLTFLLGAVVLIAGFLLLWSAKPQYNPPIVDVSQPLPKILRSSIIFGVGLVAGLEVNLLLRNSPSVLHMSLPNVNTEYITSSILLISALISLPLEKLTIQLGIKRGMLISLGAIAILMWITLFIHNGVVASLLILASGVALALLFINQIPFALAAVPPIWGGLGTGLYFGGMGAATALISIVQLIR